MDVINGTANLSRQKEEGIVRTARFWHQSGGIAITGFSSLYDVQNDPVTYHWNQMETVHFSTVAGVMWWTPTDKSANITFEVPIKEV